LGEITIYWASGSGFAWRALLAAELKGVDYESSMISFRDGENRSREYLKMNPRGRVPVLRDGDAFIYESIAIVSYLDAEFPDPPLFGGSALETARIWQRVAEHENYVLPEINRIVGPAFFGTADALADDIREARPNVHTELARLEQIAAGGPFLAGDTISAVDVVYYPSIQILLRAAGKPAMRKFELGLSRLGASYPQLDAWKSRLDALPACQKTYPPHWNAD
jgi:glutathione S-transferase